MMALWLGASSVGHNPAAALRRGIPRGETVYPRMVGALRALPKKGGISRQPLDGPISGTALIQLRYNPTPVLPCYAPYPTVVSYSRRTSIASEASACSTSQNIRSRTSRDQWRCSVVEGLSQIIIQPGVLYETVDYRYVLYLE